MVVRLSAIIRLYLDLTSPAELYTAIYRYVCSQPHIAELTVEDPAEAFEDLRDKNDLQMLLSNSPFMEEGFGKHTVSHGGGRVGGIRKGKKSGQGVTGKLYPPTNKAWAENWRRELKIAGVSAPYICSKHCQLAFIRGNFNDSLKCSYSIVWTRWIFMLLKLSACKSKNASIGSTSWAFTFQCQQLY